MPSSLLSPCLQAFGLKQLPQIRDNRVLLSNAGLTQFFPTGLDRNESPMPWGEPPWDSNSDFTGEWTGEDREEGERYCARKFKWIVISALWMGD